MSEEELITSSIKRMVKLGSVVGRVGASMLAEKAMSFMRSESSQKAAKIKNLTENAQLIFETLGKLKGAAMKAGQMISLYQGLFPQEVSEILGKLQKEAPCVPFEVMEEEIKSELKKNFALFRYINPKPFAAASIGQVHKGELKDGRKVAVKIQYPAMDYIIRSDIKNLKLFLTAMLSLFTNINPEPVWEEVQERLLEEIDYRQEAEHLREMTRLYAPYPEIVIPKIIEELSASRVITMELTEGIVPQDAYSSQYPAKLKSQWGRNLYEYALRGIWEFQYLHADPNLGNFAFLPDGRVIVYDFGCIKKIPPFLAKGYARLVQCVLEDKQQDLPGVLKEMGIYKTDGSLVPQKVIDSYCDFFGQILRKDPPYTFGDDDSFYNKLFDLMHAHWQETSDIIFPKDVVFVDRTMSGHFGNLCKFKAVAPWREIIGGFAYRFIQSVEK
ncbi:MAG: AarF/ABC1/UbiB kinase family protein [Candidatus Brocadiae bacterium]|nr:AarF/ABC1/UbiB kinase family protein [Candidatus Brocadiia bacterium]